jgi:sialate O-acetylesterase
MVIQRGMVVRIWGSATPGAAVSIKLGPAQEVVTKARTDGGWKTELPAPDPSLLSVPGDLSLACGKEKVTLHDVVAGDVWLCSGQSNMRYQLGRHEQRIGGKDDPASPLIFAKEISSSGDPMLRLLNVSSGVACTPPDRKWATCSPENVRGFSAIGYFFGRAMRRDEHVPIGLIDLGKGGASIRAFLPPDLITTDPTLQALRGNDSKNENGSVYTRDLGWLAPFALRGVLWYQGESDVTRATAYPGMLSTMVARWRSDLENPTLPFLVVELPAYGGKAGEGKDQEIQNKWRPWLCEAQENFVKSTPGTFLAVAADLGEEHEIHPRLKPPLGERLALLARAKVLRENVGADAPKFLSATKDGSSLILQFNPGVGSLVGKIRGDGVRINDFTAAGEHGDYHPAKAEIISHDKIRVSLPNNEPVTRARYGWVGYFVPSLYNDAGLPAGTFRTGPDKVQPEQEQAVETSQPVREP